MYHILVIFCKMNKKVCVYSNSCFSSSHQIGGNRKCSKQLAKSDQNLLETVFWIATCRQSVFKRFYLRSSIVLTFLIAAYPCEVFRLSYCLKIYSSDYRISHFV